MIENGLKWKNGDHFTLWNFWTLNYKSCLIFFIWGLFGLFLAILWFLGQKPKNGQKFIKMASNEKTKTTFTYATFQVWTMKVVSIFQFLSILNHFWPSFGSCPKNQKMAKLWPIWHQIKSKTTFIIQTLKVSESKVVSVFSFEAISVIFCNFLIFHNFYKAPSQSKKIIASWAH